MKKTKHIIELTLRVFKSGHITEEEATNYMIGFCQNSKIFNFNSFLYGWIFGGIVSLITLYFTK